MNLNLTKPWKLAAAGASALALLTVGIDGVTTTKDNEVRLRTQGGDVVGSQPKGYGLKVPFFQHTYNLRTDVIEITPPPLNIAIQNGTITAENVAGKAFIRLNGTHEDRVETAKLIYANMNQFEDRLTSLTEKAMRDVIRESIVVTTDDVTKAGDQNQLPVPTNSSKPDFLNSKLIGSLITQSLQESINSIIPGQINVGTKEKPSMVNRIEVTQVAIANFDWDKAYKDKQHGIQEARAKAEQARYAEQEGLRTASGLRAKADGERDAEKSRGDGRAYAKLAEETAVATGLKKRIEAAGGVDNLERLIKAQNWNGSYATTVSGTAIVDARGDKSNKPTVVPVGP